MSNPTKQQQEAIDVTGNNVIVSAGAGSGKTFVLKERVLKEVQNGNPINNFIILTFTKKAANEMKERIRNILTDNKVEDAKYVDSAYISTFDSYAHSLVKKYNYLLNIDKDFGLIDKSIVKTELKNILNNILEDKYKNKDENFIHLINNMCYKDDDSFRENILKLYSSYQNIVNKDEVLNIDKYYTENFINDAFDEYEKNAFNDLSVLREIIQESVDNSEAEKAIKTNQELLELVDSITSFDEIIDNIPNFSLATNRIGTYYDYDAQKIIGKTFSDKRDKFKEQYKYCKKDLINQYKSTYNDVIEIKNIILELDKQITNFKNEHNAYEFVDIAFKAIELVRDNESIRNEIRDKKNTYEIMIDEYQDTNDIQEEFISYIANNNVYMVGDIKQSIYGFRNANPSLFKSKYDNFKDGINGYKIDLTSNFRSRSEVVKTINDMFSLLMYDNVGGANYIKSHIMDAGNKDYDDDKNRDKVNYNPQIITYNNEDKKYRKDLIDAYIIADDINKKMKEDRHALHDKSFDKLSYKDFCILVDNSTRFDTLKQVLESKGIPAYIAKSLSIKNDDEIFIFKNLITCLTCIKNKEFKEKFKHAFASIARSYIIDMTDDEMYQAIKFNKYKETELFKKLESISEDIDSLSNKEILYLLIDEFDIINKTITVASIDERLAKLEYFINQADSLNKFGLDIYSMEEYFSNVIESEDDDLEMEIEQSDKDAVTIMTIHGSKGLEFNYVYMPYLFTTFSKTKKDKFLLNKDLGILIPFYDDGLDNTFIYNLYEQNIHRETISEKIRLFYVAITRAKESITFITEFNSKLENKEINENTVLDCNSFTDFITLTKNVFGNNITEVSLKDLSISNTYYHNAIDINNLIKHTDDTIEVNELSIKNEKLENKHFSHELDDIMNEDLHNILDLGTRMHYAYEVCDFKNDNIDSLNISEEEKQYLRNFLNHDEVKNIKDAIIYKEHEIKHKDNDSIMHGFIDLLLKYDDHFDIIDYKTSGIDNPEYVVQLTGYKKYIEKKYKLPTNIYLYSIKNDKFKKL